SLMIYSILAGAIGLDLKCSHCAASTLSPQNNASCDGNSDNSRIEDVWSWLNKSYDPSVIDSGLFEWERYASMILTRRCVLAFFPDDLGETLFDLFRIQAELAFNPELKVMFIPRNGIFHNDFAISDVDSWLSESCFSSLRRCIDCNRFVICANGPRNGS